MASFSMALPFGASFAQASSLKQHRQLHPARCAALRVRAAAAAAAVDVAKVVPQADRVLVRLEELPEVSEGGVLLPKSATKFERYLIGEVLSVGKDAGGVDKGQKVMFSDVNAYEVNLGTEEKLCFCKAGDLLAVVS